MMRDDVANRPAAAALGGHRPSITAEPRGAGNWVAVIVAVLVLALGMTLLGEVDRTGGHGDDIAAVEPQR